MPAHNPPLPTMGRWLAVVGGITAVALAVFLVGFAVIRADLPPRIATHWGSDGVDGTQSHGALSFSVAGILLGLLAFHAVLARFIPAEGRRVLGASCSGLAAFIAVGIGGTVWAQRGLSDPAQADSAVGGLVAGAVAAIPAAFLAWRLMPVWVPDASDVPPGRHRAGSGRQPAPGGAPGAAGAGQGSPEPAGVAHLRATGSWSAPIPAGTIGYWILGITVLMGIGLIATPARWISTPIMLVIAGIVGAMTRARLVVDREALKVTSGPITWLRAPLRTVATADVEVISPLGDFGGYGLRYARKGKGFVTVGGPALHVVVPGGSDVWVSCADPGEAAAVLVTAIGTSR